MTSRSQGLGEDVEVGVGLGDPCGSCGGGGGGCRAGAASMEVVFSSYGEGNGYKKHRHSMFSTQSSHYLRL